MIIVKILGIIYLISVILLALVAYAGVRVNKDLQIELSELYKKHGKFYLNITLLFTIMFYPVAIALFRLKKIKR